MGARSVAGILHEDATIELLRHVGFSSQPPFVEPESPETFEDRLDGDGWYLSSHVD
jgi:hypothetical protein